MTRRRLLAACLLSASLTLGAVGTAAAHECVIASRSAQGDAGALHSGRWETLTLSTVFSAILPDALGVPALTPDQLTWALDAAAAAGVPSSWVTRSDKTIAEGSSDPNLADGKGLDHLADAYGQQLAGIYFAALSH